MNDKFITIPDPQVLEMDALDDAFYDWLDPNDEDYDYWVDRWNEIDRNALVFFPSDDDEYDPYDEDGAREYAMEKDMQSRIDIKRRIIYEINKGD